MALANFQKLRLLTIIFLLLLLILYSDFIIFLLFSQTHNKNQALVVHVSIYNIPKLKHSSEHIQHLIYCQQILPNCYFNVCILITIFYDWIILTFINADLNDMTNVWGIFVFTYFCQKNVHNGVRMSSVQKYMYCIFEQK